VAGRGFLWSVLIWAVLAVGAAPTLAATNQVDLANAANIRIDGASARENAGFRVAAVGDINGDGHEDFAISSDGSSAGPREAGSVFVVYGGNGPLTGLDLGNLGSRGFRIDGGSEYDDIGWSLAGAGDFNGDGVDDLLFGSSTVDYEGKLNTGAVWVVYGQKTSDLADLDLTDLESGQSARGFRVVGPSAEAELSYSAAGVGDFNGDGVDDIAVGAPGIGRASNVSSGSAFVIYGQAVADVPDLDLANLPTTAAGRGLRIKGGPRDGLGENLAAAGDFNGDGLEDLVLGAPYASNGGLYGQDSDGGAYVVYGQHAADPSDFSVTELGTTAAARGMIVRADSGASTACCGSLTGWKVAGRADLNDDGLADVMIDAVRADFDGRAASGTVYVLYGKLASDPADIDLSQLEAGAAGRGARIDGAAAGELLGSSLAAVGDVDGDGIEDVAIGTTQTSANGRARSGSVYVVYGQHRADPPDLDLATMATDAGRGFRIDGAEAGDDAGSSIAGIGDVTGDGLDDILIGAPHFEFDSFTSGPGAVFIPQRIARPGPTVGFDPQVVETESAVSTATLTEMTGGEIEVEAVELGGEDADQFQIVGDGCTEERLDAGQSCPVTVSFSPHGSRGIRQAVLRFRDDASNSVQEVQLQGEALPDPEAVDDSVTAVEDTTTSIDVLANDIDREDEPITIQSTTQPAHGIVTLTAGVEGGRTGLTYTPTVDYCNDPPGSSTTPSPTP